MKNLTLLLGTTLLLINISFVFSANLFKPNLQVQGQNFNLDPRRITKQIQTPGAFVPKLSGQGSFNSNVSFNPPLSPGDVLRTTNDLFNIGYHGVTKPIANAAVKSIANIGTAPLKSILKSAKMDHLPDEFVDTAIGIGNTIGDAVVDSKDNLVNVKANLLDNAGAYADEAGAALQQQADETAALVNGVHNGFNQFQDQFVNGDDDRRSRRHSSRHSRHSRDSRRHRDSKRDKDSKRSGSKLKGNEGTTPTKDDKTSPPPA